MFKHRGGSLSVWDNEGNKVDTIHYGPDLHKDCKDCKQESGKLCITKSGNPLKKTHKARGA